MCGMVSTVVLHLRRQRFVQRQQHDGLTARRDPSNVHRRDVDVGLA